MEFDTFIPNEDTIQSGKEIELLIRERETFMSRFVRAIVDKEVPPKEGENKLWAMNPLGVNINKDPWVIKILEEFDEEDAAKDDDRFHKCGLD